MEVIARPRGAGKTTELVKLAYKNNACILVASNQQRDIVWDIALKMGMESMPYPVTLKELQERRVGQGLIRRGFIIDNADIMLQEIIGFPIHAITVSTNDISANL